MTTQQYQIELPASWGIHPNIFTSFNEAEKQINEWLKDEPEYCNGQYSIVAPDGKKTQIFA